MLLTAFVLLPGLGLSRSIWIAAATNVLVFLLAAFLVQREALVGPSASGAGSDAGAARPVAPDRAPGFPWIAPPSPVWVLPLMLVSGAVSFMQEVLWARMLSQIVGSSIYAFGVMVGSFLAGIALGGTVGALLASTRSRAIAALIVAQIVCAGAAAAAFLLLEQVVPARAGLLTNVFFGFALLLPLTFAIGTTYPLAVRILADAPEQAAAASARVYTWNTVGGILGSIAAGFFVIPALRYEGTIKLAVAASALLAVLCVVLLVERRRLVLGAGLAAAAIAGVLAFRPGVPERLLLSSPLNVGSVGEILYYDVGRSASVVVLQQDGGLALRTNGLPEALMDSPGTPPRFSGEFWMSSLAVIARPETRNMLVVGFGGGVVVEGVPPSVSRIDVIELEPKVIEANLRTRERRKFDPMRDPRVNLITNDARGALALTQKRYEAIVSQPSHPWTAGASHLYTREFMRLARDHLTDDGVFVQWMNVAFLDEALLRSLTATLIDVFGATRIYRPDPNTLVFVASSGPLDVEPRVVRNGGAPIVNTPGHYGRFGINAVEDLVAALAVDEDGARELAAGAPLITDDNNRMATSSVFELGRGLTADAAGRVLAAYDPLQRGAPWLFQGLAGQVDFGYIARRLVFFRALDPSSLDRVRKLSRFLGDTPAARYTQVLLYAVAGQSDQARQFTRESLAAFPGSDTLRYASLQPFIGAIARGTADKELMSTITALPTSAQATLQGTRNLLAGKFGDLAQLDASLAEARWTDLWFADAQQLRAEWRSRVANPEISRSMADQAITLVDRLLVIQPSLAMFAVRARAALNADRPDVLVESIANVAQWTAAQSASGGSESRDRSRAQLTELLKLLEGRDADARVNPRRLSEVRARIDEALKRMS